MTKALLHVSEQRRRVVDPRSVFYLQSSDGDTLVRRRGTRMVRDARQLGQMMKSWSAFGFVRVHRNYAVQADRITEIRARTGGRGWEIKLAPPVNTIIPVGRSYLRGLWAAFGE